MIQRAAVDQRASIIDVGGGESTLVDDLIAKAYQNITVLDISQTAIDVTKTRLGESAKAVNWITADIARANLPTRSYDVWHDRAVFHFLTSYEERVAYVRAVASAVKPGGHVIVGTFRPGRPYQVQWPRRGAVWCRSIALPVRAPLSFDREYEGIASHAVGDHAGVSLLLLRRGSRPAIVGLPGEPPNARPFNSADPEPPHRAAFRIHRAESNG